MKNYPYFLLFFIGFTFSISISTYSQVSFKTGQSLSTAGSWYEVVATGDVNNDGLIDIVAATGYYFSPQYDYKLLVYLQSQTGTFPATTSYNYSPVYPGIQTIAVNDVNNDLFNDVVIGFGDSIGIFYQNNSGTLNSMLSYYSGKRVNDLQVADVNNDSLNDIVVCHWNDNYIKVFYQTSGLFSENTYPKTPGGYDEIEVGDVNSDGLNDVVYMSGQGSGGIHVFFQNFGNTLDNYISYFPEGGGLKSCSGIVIADLNNDGANDIAATQGGNMPDASLKIWYQDTLTHLLQPAISTPAYEIPDNIAVADFNCDGNQEIVMNHNGWNTVSVWTKDSIGKYVDYNKYPVSVKQHPKPQGLSIADINSDGILDVVMVGDFTTIQLLYNNSIPMSFSKIDTLVLLDTVSTQNYSVEYYFTTTKIDTFPTYIINHTDSFKVTYYDNEFSLKTDSIYTREGFLCSTLYKDVIADTTYSLIINQGNDTLFWSSTIDTVQTSASSDFGHIAISISPNPFLHNFTVKYDAKELVLITLYDFFGQLVLQQVFINSTTINTEQLADGIYYYEIRNIDTIIKTGKLIKQ